MKKLLTVEDLRVSLRAEQRELVRGISFSVDAGKSLVLLGQSGSGKTMTCRSIMGLLDAKRFMVTGSVLYNEKEILTMKKRERCMLYGGDISFVPQNPMTVLDPSMRIGKQMCETLVLHKKVTKSESVRIARQTLKRAGLQSVDTILRSYPYTLSGGMLQRVIIAMAHMTQAKLILADEPTTALDVVHRNETIDTFTTLRNAGAAIFMVTHDFSAASQLGGELCIMKEGELIEYGQTKQVLRSPQNEYTRVLIEASSLSQRLTKGEPDECLK